MRNISHEKDVERLCQEIKNRSTTLTLDPHISNVTRSMDYKKQGNTLKINHLNRLINIDPERKIARVEPRMTMEQLYIEVKKAGFVPLVVPEFKGITVGGAVMGAALESSSHAYGQFNDACTGYEVILGNGEKVWASPTENPDLFYGLAGSYGSLGTLTLIEMKLEKATDWIELNYHLFDSIPQAIAALIEIKNRKNPPHHLEGIVFSKNKTIIVEGNRVDTIEQPPHTISLKNSWSPWFYQYVKESRPQQFISTEDYLFRHDRGAFWMGSYATHPELFLRYLIEGVGGYHSVFPEWDKKKAVSKYILKDPGPLFRMLTGWMMPSQRLYGLLHHGSEGWFEDKFVIQDFYIPEKNTQQFVNEVLEKYPIFPIWLCPIKGTSTPQIFSPHYCQNNQDFIDVGLYGLPQNDGLISSIIHDMEKSTQRLGGRKMLYSYSYYTPDEFWKIYSKKDYTNLREKYHAEGIWLDIIQKLF